MKYVHELDGYTVGQEIEYINPDYDTGVWARGKILQLDADRDDLLPYCVSSDYDYAIWVKKDAIRPISDAQPVQLEYRVKYEGADWTEWVDLYPGINRWSNISAFQTRVKQEFIPGYFRVTNHVSAPNCPVYYFTKDPGNGYERVNVTPAE